jgi:transposase
VPEVIVGVDPAKRSHTLVVIDGQENVLGQLRVPASTQGYRQLRRFVRQWPVRRWAVEGAGGVGSWLAQRLVADGETVLDVPAKLSVRARIFDTGHGRKNDPADARTVAVAALHAKSLRPVQPADETLALRLLSDRRSDLVRTRTQTVNRLHDLLTDLIPGGADKRLSASTARTLLAKVRPRDVAGKTRRALAADLIDDLTMLDRKLNTVGKQLAEAVEASGTRLTEIVGVGVITAATILGEVGDVRRFASRHHFASYTGTAPIDASSGDVKRHRLSRAGNRRLNSALHIAALAHRRADPRGRAYYAKQLAAGKGSKGAMRALKRRLADVVYRRLVADAKHTATGPEGHSGATLQSSAAGSTPHASSSDQPLTGPATNHPRTEPPLAS